MDIQIIETGPIPIVNLLGDVNADDADKLEKIVDSMLTKSKASRVIFDLSHAKYIASNIFGVLLSSANQLRHSGGKVAVVGASERIKEVLHLLSMEQYFDLFKTREEALKAFQKE
jgi:anti-sigma B factor antagonist